MDYKITEGTETRITLNGKLDFASAPKLMEDLAALKGKDIQTIVFECADLTYISSAGIRVIIYAQQKIAAGISVVLEDVTDAVGEVFDMCGLTDFVEIRESSQ